MTRLYDAHLLAVGLTLTQYSLLANLRRLSPPSIHELATVMGMDRTSLTRILAPLRTRGLIAFGAGEDRRSKVVLLTENGRHLYVMAQSYWRTAQDDMRRRLGEDDLTQLHRLLDRAFDCLG